MNYRIFLIPAAAALLTCRQETTLHNQTRAGGYAMGENILLRFALSGIDNPPDSIDVSIWEKKTDYIYFLRAELDSCDTLCGYSLLWDGRKPDGRWPAGGRYLVYAKAELKHIVYSDTVAIGMAD